ncbi:hypothetical protein [Microbacterium sp.]|uniref:hypothetical protein n=1 Tax=Microbacterium sp. TaxID=51671 RepID=UPI003A935492
MGIGQISLLVDSPLRTVSLAFAGLDAEVRKQITRQVKTESKPIWFEEIRDRASTRLQQRVLAGTARTGVAGLNVRLMAGGGKKLSSGTPTADLVKATEFGANPGRTQTVRSRKGKQYQRRLGGRFPAPRRGGYVVYPAAKAAIPRVASLVVQTTVRTIHETIEGVSNG